MNAARESRATGRVCATCGRELRPSEEAWRHRIPFGKNGFGLGLTCIACFEHQFEGYSPEWREFDRAWAFAKYVTVQCAGCGRVLHRKADRRLFRRFESCSDRCWQRAHAAHRKAQRQTRMRRICAVCGAAFTGRRDAAACSSTCRQRAFRQRHRRDQSVTADRQGR
jgi:hypothetical protein